MKFVQNNRVYTLEGWIGQQPASENALRDEMQSCAWSGLLLEADLVAYRFADLFAHLPRNSSCRQTRSNSAWFQHDHSPADETEDGRRNARCLTRSRRRFDDNVRGVTQGGQELRQNHIHRKC